MDISCVRIGNILTRSTGFLQTVTSHSLQPYRGCTFGRALCGVGCYVQHQRHILRGRPWGGFLEVRTNAAESYLAHVSRERSWAGRRGRPFSIFCSSSTDPFLPQEDEYAITDSLLRVMCETPPDELVLQTHTHRIAARLDLLRRLAGCCRLRCHVTIETDRVRLPGLPAHASPVEHRLEACAALKRAGIETVVTVAPLLPIEDPARFFQRIAESAHAVVLDHFIQGDGSRNGTRTAGTDLPRIMAELSPDSLNLTYLDEMATVARRFLPNRVGVHVDGFAGRYLSD